MSDDASQFPSHPSTPTRRLQRFINRLLEPTRLAPTLLARRRARLLAGLLLSLVITDLVGLAVWVLDRELAPPYKAAYGGLIITALVGIVTVYLLNRRGRYPAAAAATVWGLTAATWLSTLISVSQGTLGILFIACAILISSLLQSLWMTGLVILTNSAFMAALAYYQLLPVSLLDLLPFMSFITMVGLIIGALSERDLARLERQAQDLAESEARYRLLMETLPYGIEEVARDGVITFSNTAHHRLHGYEPGELMGRKFWELLADPSEELKAQFQHVQLLEQPSTPTTLFATDHTKDGRLIDVQIDWNYRRDERGRVIGFVAIVSDITERKRAEGVLRQRENILETVAFAANRFLLAGDWRASIQEVLARLGQETGASHVYIFANHHAPDGSELASQHYEWAALGIPAHITDSRYQSYSIATDELKVWTETLRRGEPYFGRVEASASDESAHLAELGVKAFLEVPIFVSGEWWGFLGLDDCIVEREWSLAERDALKSAAGMLGAAIQNQQVGETLRRQTEYLAALHETALGLMNRLRLDDLLETIVQRAAHLLETEHGFIALRSTGGQVVELKVGLGMYRPLVGMRAAPGEGLSGKVWQSLQPMVVDDYAAWGGRQPSDDFRTRALVGIPLISGPEFLGVLGIAHVASERRIDDTQVELLKRFGQLAAIALDNARLYAAAQQEIAARAQAEAAQHKTNEQLADWLIEAETMSQRITLLNKLIGQVQACPTEAEACDAFKRWGQQLFAEEWGAVYLLKPGMESAELVVAWGRHWHPQLTRPDCFALQNGVPRSTSPSAAEPPCPHLQDQLRTGAWCMPIMAQGEVLGVLVLQSASSQAPLSKDKQSLVHTLAESLALTLVNLRLRDRLREQSIRDPLTGLFNRRYMEESLEREISRAARHHKAVSVIMLDIDYFKNFNDSHGHLAGDALLREVGNFLGRNLRLADIACRYGGEEFTLILPDAPLEAVRQRAEALCQAIRDVNIEWQGQWLGPVTLSLGVAVYPRHGMTGYVILRAADEALYHAKREGRNRVVMAT